MGRFLTNGQLTPRPDKGTRWGGWPKFYEVTQEFRYLSNAGKIVSVPKGFLTDGASTGPAWFVVPPWGPYQAGAVIHDWLISRYKAGNPQEGGETPLAIDNLFYEVMKEGGTYALLRNVMYAAVRIANWSARDA